MTIPIPILLTGGAFLANAVTLAPNSNLSLGGAWSGASDSKQVTGSMWWKLATDASQDIVFVSEAGGITLFFSKGASGFIRILGKNSAGTKILEYFSVTPSLKVSDGWASILFSFDLTGTSGNDAHIYINNIDKKDNVPTFTNDFVDFAGGSKTEAYDIQNDTLDVAEVWLDIGTYIDFSVAANRNKFINNAGKPVDLGSNGSSPTGTSPILFFSGATTDWSTNKGTGGGYSGGAALVTAPTSPSD